MKTAILGATGMLGSQVLRTLRGDLCHHVVATVRNPLAIDVSVAESTRMEILDAGSATVDSLVETVGDCDWWINCIGMIKPYIRDDDPKLVAEAIKVNSLFPAVIAQAAQRSDTRVIEISTDCVWDGADGNYSELAHHNAMDVYGKSKSLGEVEAECVHTIRCSIIGRGLHNQVSLLDWFLGQETGAILNGFTNHYWNGVTTLQFSKVCKGIMENDLPLRDLQHLVPADAVTKFDLLGIFARQFSRDDLTIYPFETEHPVDRTISTIDPEHNVRLWACGGYDGPPTVEESVAELASHYAS